MTDAELKAKRSWFKKKRWWATGALVALIALFAATSGGGGNSSASGTTTTASTPTTSATTVAGSASTASTAPATTTTAVASVLFQQTGSGTASTANFTTPSNWDIDWTYDCTAYGSEGNFVVSIEQANTGAMASLEDDPINQLGTSGSGVQHYHYGGKLYLSIDSECSWTVKAVPAS